MLPIAMTAPVFSFHSTKEVSKDCFRCGGSKTTRVSIPLRKFPRKAATRRRPPLMVVSIPLRKFPRRRNRGYSALWETSFHSTKEVSKVSLPARPGAQNLSFHSTKEVSKAARAGCGRRCGPEVSIPLRKFPRWDYLDQQRVVIQVSIPLRKFPRSVTILRRSQLRSCFHSTKEVSKGARGHSPERGGNNCFHSTKEVSKASCSAEIASRISGFHSTKEVSKGACRGFGNVG